MYIWTIPANKTENDVLSLRAATKKSNNNKKINTERRRCLLNAERDIARAYRLFYSRPILINYITALDSKRIDGTGECSFFQRATVNLFNIRQNKKLRESRIKKLR